VGGRAIVAGLFVVRMDIVDADGQVISAINASTLRPRHVVEIENITTLPWDVRVYITLPYGIRSLEFANSAKSSWMGEAMRIPPSALQQVSMELVRASGANGAEESIRCVEIHEKYGFRPWTRVVSSRLPFRELTIRREWRVKILTNHRSAACLTRSETQNISMGTL
jgi:hypothetical protein